MIIPLTNVHCGDTIYPEKQDDIKRLAQYIVRTPISQERTRLIAEQDKVAWAMIYISAKEFQNGVAKVVYSGKNSRTTQTFDALDWLAR